MPEFEFQNTSPDFDERTKALLKELTTEEKLLLITTHQNAIPRLGMKETYIGAEVARGLVCRGKDGEFPTTVFPEPFGLAATFDPDVMREMGAVTGKETRVYNDKGKTSLFVWGPTVDPERDPRWGRNEEAYGEDPCLIGKMSAAYTEGMYGTDKKFARVIPTLKHFFANNNEENRGSDNASVPEILKHEYYMKAFETPVAKGKARSLMTAYNSINGIEALCNPELDSICKKQWGLLFSVTDGGDFVQNVQYHRTDKTHEEAIARIYHNHGADIMTDSEEIVRDAARKALADGTMTESDIDNALFGVLKARFLLGEFDEHPFRYTDDIIACDEHFAIAEKAAEESVILLRNNKGVLPLSKDKKLAVIGVHADMNFRDWYTGYSENDQTILGALTAELGRENIVYESGCDIVALRNAASGFYFSVDEDGTLVCDSAMITENCLFDMYDWGDGAFSLKSRFNNKFLCDSGVMKCTSDGVYGWFVKEKFYMERRGSECVIRNWQNRLLKINPDRTVTVSSQLRAGKENMFNAEVFSSGAERVRRAISETHDVVYFCGNNPQIGARECTDRKHIEFPEKQRRIFDVISSIRPNAVIFIISGYPYALDDKAETVLHMAHGGPAMGQAVTRVLFGDVSPAGRCPVTWYSGDSELCDIKDYNIIRTESTYLYYKGKPLFPFGHGLSYTTFRYASVKADKPVYKPDDKVEVSFDLENTGHFDSDEVVQLYAAYPKMARPLPIKQLKAFARVNVPKGKKKRVTLTFDVSDLALWNINTEKFEVFGGTYELQVGASSGDIRRTVDIKIDAPEYDGIDVTKAVPATAACDYLGVEFTADRALNVYALMDDWQSFLRYEGCRMQAKRKIEITASNPGVPVKVSVVCEQTGQEIASVTVPPTGSLSEFTTVIGEAVPMDGIFTLKITCDGMLSFRSFRFTD